LAGNKQNAPLFTCGERDFLAIAGMSHTLVLANSFDPVFAEPKWEVDMLATYGRTNVSFATMSGLAGD
jgi:hypothetical protein